MILSANHQPSVNAVATLLEQKLEELENYLLRNEFNARRVRIAYQYDLTEEQKKGLQREIDNLYKLLSEFCTHYKVSKETLSLQREVHVKASFLWEELSGASGKKFTGYGNSNIDLEIKNEYDQFINEMIEKVNNIIQNTIKN